MSAFGCFLLAVVAFAGWNFDLPILTSFIPGGPSLFPSTGIGLVAVSGVLFFLQWQPHGFLPLKSGLALAVLCLGLASLVFRVVDWVPMPFSLNSGSAATAWSLPSPISAGLFIVTGLGLWLINSKRYVEVAQAGSVATLLLCLLILAGYSANDTVLYHSLPGRGTSLPTTLGFLSAAIGILGLRSQDGLMAALFSSAVSSRLLRQLFLPAIIAPSLLGLGLVTVVQTTSLFNDVATAIWVFVWALLVVLIVIMWRFAYQLHQAEIARELIEHERNAAMAALHLANERKNEFLAMLAHELRNPLAPISTAAALLKTAYASDPVQVRRTSEVIARQVGHMVHLVDDLLDVSRVTRGVIALDRQILDVRQAVADAIEQVEPLMRMKGHELETSVPPDRLLVEGDYKRLVQVVANLLNNAAKYTPPNGRLAIFLTKAEGTVTIQVQDNGVGIPPALLGDVFGLFIQAERTPDRSQGGLGLGLALVKALVELHGGTVSAHSEGIGKGSIFTIELPEAVEQNEQPVGQGSEAPSPQARGALKVLIVDDNIDAANTLSSVLQVEGYQVVVTYASDQALTQARKENPDVCIIDIGLPDMDGYELAKRLRAQPGHPSPLLIALTGYGSQTVRATAAEAGYKHYFVKPAPMQDLLATLANIPH